MLTMLLILWLARTGVRACPSRLKIAVRIAAISAMITTVTPAQSVAQDRYFQGINANPEHEILPEKSQGKGVRKRLREGTLVPSTIGRIVLLGRRWAFVPAGQETTGLDVGARERDTFASRTTSDLRPRPSRLGAGTRPDSSLQSNPALATLISAQVNGQNAFDLNLPHLILVENLTLQRIVEAIRADASDDQWAITGEITEFFSENRLVIRTAQRANSR